MTDLNPVVRTLVRHCPRLAVASLLAACTSTTDPPAVNDERDALVVLYESTGGPDWWHQGGWLSDYELGTWYGVDTDFEERVTHIRLDGNKLNGTIPSELGALARLEVLSLNGNWLTGEIPPELGEVANLEVLNLRQNRLTGEIPPELGGLANLEVLSLRQNGLTGEIPPELGQLTNVKWLSLYINQLSGPIPPELLELEQVEGLVLGHNRLTGSIPPGLGSMRSLERLWLNDNRLTGAVPSELGDLRHQLEWLDFQENRNLSGPLPRELTNLTGLFRFEWGTTDLCSPPDREFQDWVYSVQTWYGRGPVCGS